MIQTARLEKPGLTLDVLGRAVGRNRTTVNEWEQAIRVPTEERDVVCLASVLKLEPDDLRAAWQPALDQFLRERGSRGAGGAVRPGETAEGEGSASTNAHRRRNIKAVLLVATATLAVIVLAREFWPLKTPSAQIAYPVEGQEVRCEETARGRASHVSTSSPIFLVVRVGNGFYPQGRIWSDRWTMTVFFGGPNDAGRPFVLLAQTTNRALLDWMPGDPALGDRDLQGTSSLDHRNLGRMNDSCA